MNLKHGDKIKCIKKETAEPFGPQNLHTKIGNVYEVSECWTDDGYELVQLKELPGHVYPAWEFTKV